MNPVNLIWSLMIALLTFCIGVTSNSLVNSMLTVQTVEFIEQKPLLNELNPNEDVNIEKQEEAVRLFWTNFQKAVATNNKKQIASMMKYPLKVRFSTDPRPTDYRLIENPSELIKVYDKVFHNYVKEYIAKTKPDEIWGNSYIMQTGYGEIKIAVSRKDKGGSYNYSFEIQSIASNMIVIDEKANRCGPTITCWINADNEQNRQNTK